MIAGNSIRQKLTEVTAQKRPIVPAVAPSIAPSRVASTIVPSEINGGVTRMQISNRLKHAAPSIVPSTVVPSEINGGATRMNMNQKLNRGYNANNTNRQQKNVGKSHMPAGFERDSHSFDKHNNRF